MAKDGFRPKLTARLAVTMDALPLRRRMIATSPFQLMLRGARMSAAT